MVIYSDVDWLDRSPCGWQPPPSPPWGGRPLLPSTADCSTVPRIWWTGSTCERPTVHQSPPSCLGLITWIAASRVQLTAGWWQRRLLHIWVTKNTVDCSKENDFLRVSALIYSFKEVQQRGYEQTVSYLLQINLWLLWESPKQVADAFKLRF